MTTLTTQTPQAGSSKTAQHLHVIVASLQNTSGFMVMTENSI